MAAEEETQEPLGFFALSVDPGPKTVSLSVPAPLEKLKMGTPAANFYNSILFLRRFRPLRCSKCGITFERANRCGIEGVAFDVRIARDPRRDFPCVQCAESHFDRWNMALKAAYGNLGT